MSIKFFSAVLMFGALGIAVGLQTWNQVSRQYYRAELKTLLTGRSPAAIHKSLEVSQIDGAELIQSSSSRLVATARIILKDSDLGLELGHFVTHNGQGGRLLACDYFDRIEMTFDGEGVADSGNKPVMRIEGPCRTGDDVTRIEAIWIPVGKILNEKPSDMELSFSEGVNFNFENMSSEWPERWVLQSVRMKHQAASASAPALAPEKDLLMTETELSVAGGVAGQNKLALDWTPIASQRVPNSELKSNH
jgi:hypothetical protein